MQIGWKTVPGNRIAVATLVLVLLLAGAFTVSAQDTATPTAPEVAEPETAEATPVATPILPPLLGGEYPVGTALVTTADSLRLRTQPTTDAETLMTLPAGTEVQVIGGPEQAESFTWYEVEVLDTDEPLTGWIATSADFVDPAQDAVT
ncbi:MAG TPA: SH3 domain-containing protein [Thermomicrobiales bacterium]|nr:SH3 domain-containing protein [Thermomicrobiales bacterium]